MFKVDRSKFDLDCRWQIQSMLRYAAILVGLASLGACADNKEELRYASTEVLGEKMSAGARCPEHAAVSPTDLHPGEVERIERSYPNKDIFRLSAANDTTVQDSRGYHDQQDIFFGPADATFQRFSDTTQFAHVPAGYIGYIKIKNDNNLYCRMISIKGTRIGRIISQILLNSN